MLQWMGGSRRKVTASRKSVQNRQKQYFDQRKRQQQSSGLEFYDQEGKKCSQFDADCRSLDVLTLKHVVGSFDGCNTNASPNGAFGKEKVDSIPLSSIPSEFVGANSLSPLGSNKRIYGTVPKLIHHKEIASQKNQELFSAITTDQQGVRNQTSDQSDNHGNPLYTSPLAKLSVLELVGDEGCQGNYRIPIMEEHVAFSVEGLGKVGVKTPVHSPNDSSRAFSNEGFPLPMDREIKGSRKKLKHVGNDYFCLEQDRVDGIQSFFGQIVPECSKVVRSKNLPRSSDEYSMDGSLFSQTVNDRSNLVKQKNLPISRDVDGTLENLYVLPIDEVLAKTGKFCSKNNNKGIHRWFGSYDCQSENMFNEDALWKTEPFNGEICDHDFGDAFVASTRHRAGYKKHVGHAGFIPDSLQMNFPQHFQCNASEGYDFLPYGESCSPSEVPNKKIGAKNQDLFMSFSPEIAGETLSLSDESSSTTVKGITMMRSDIELKQLKSKRKKSSGAYHGELNSVWSKDSFEMSETSNVPLEPKDIFQDKFDSLDLELAASPVHAISLHEGKPDFVDWKIDDCLEPSCLTPKLRGAIFVDHNSSVPSGQVLEKQPLEETSEFMYQAEAHPDISSGVNPENKKECQAETRSNKSDEDLTSLQEATSMAKRDSSIETGKAVDSCSKHEPVKKSIKAVHSDDVVENFEKTPENLEICVKNTTSDVNGAIVPSQICRTGNSIRRRTNIKGKGHQGDDPSYQVMLESCVLQLVCVQKKVQLEALTQGSV